MIRIERRDFFNFRHKFRGHTLRLAVFGAAVDQTVTDGGKSMEIALRAEPIEHRLYCCIGFAGGQSGIQQNPTF